MNVSFRFDLATASDRRKAWIDALFIDHAVLRLGWTNFAAVEPGVLYRSNHPVPFQLARLKRKVGLRSVINLRGNCNNGAAALSRDAAERLGLDFYEVGFGSREAPYRERVLRLAEIYRTMARPALVHCKSGADRAGLASAIFLLMEGVPVAEARRQLSLRYGHIREASTGVLDAFLDMYEEEGGAKPFLDWVAEDYRQQDLRERFAARRAERNAGRAIARFVNDRLLARE